MWKNDKDQFVKFMNAQLFNEYNCFDLLYKNRVQTKKGTHKVQSIYTYLEDPEYVEALLNYTYSIINGSNPFNKMLVAKFLTIPRLSKRKGHKQFLPETKTIMNLKAEFLSKLSDIMGWEKKYFKGYREWRKQYNGTLESVLFSTKKINEFTKDEFVDWFDQLPALARNRVEARVYNSIVVSENLTISDAHFKWDKFRSWIREWENRKEEKQKEQRILEEKIRQGQATDEEKERLKEVVKEAKVTTGAVNFENLYEDIVRDRVDKLKLESFINKIHLDYNTLVIIDDSGSMTGEPFNFACFLASVCLVKNPDDDGRNLLGFFSDHSHWHGFMDSTSSRRNNILRTQISQTNKKPLVDPTLSFYDNYKRISKFCNSVFSNGCTYLNSVIRDLKPLVDENPELLDTLKSYPVWTIVSDGDLNSNRNAKESFQQFFDDCQEAFGFKPYLVLIDIGYTARFHPEKFEGLENFMYIPGNVNLIEQFLTNFKDMDTLDVYSSLQAIYRSNRYEVVRQNTL